MEFGKTVVLAPALAIFLLVAVLLPSRVLASEDIKTAKNHSAVAALEIRVTALEAELKRIQAQLADQQHRLNDWLPFKRDAAPSPKVPQ